MKLLADENLDGDVVRWLRVEGNDVFWVAESMAGATDPEVPAVATGQQRILITYDLDFGEHVFRHHLNAFGIILLRLSPSTQAERLEIVRRHWSLIAARAAGYFVVVTDKKLRARPLL
ncbi:MAG: DUF5615 family PIN-like protein [Tepidisphaeraceae bacterium]